MSIPPPSWNRKLRFVGNTGIPYSTGLEKESITSVPRSMYNAKKILEILIQTKATQGEENDMTRN